MTIKALYPTINPTLNLDFANTKTLGPLVTFTRASSATYVGSDGLIKTATTNEPRFDHNPTTGESLGLLVEEQRTNLVLRSEEFDNASWTQFSGNVTANTTIAPNGSLSADTYTANGLSAVHRIQQSAAASAGKTVSIYAKAGTGTVIQILLDTDTAPWANFDIASGSVGSQGSNQTASIIPAGDGWYRCVLSTSSATATNINFAVVSNASSARGEVNSSVNTVFLWGAQLEAGAFATSYIPTTTAAATRSADVASITGANFSSWYRQDEGTVFAETQLPFGSAVNTNSRTAIDITDGSTNNRVNLRAIGGATTADQLTVRSGASTSAQFSSNGSAISTTFRRLACAVRVDDFASWATGATTAATDTSGAMPVALNQTTIGSSVAGTEVLCGTIRRLTYWPQRLPNSTLQTITQ